MTNPKLGNVQIKIGDLELRTVKGIGGDDDHLSIVRWTSPATSNDCGSCYTLAYWKESKEGPDLLFVGPRPFEEGVDRSTFWYLAKTGQEMLDRLETATDD